MSEETVTQVHLFSFFVHMGDDTRRDSPGEKSKEHFQEQMLKHCQATSQAT